MEEIIKQLELKNEWLSKLQAITQNFLVYIENQQNAALEDTDYYLNNRDSLLNIIQKSDKKIRQFAELRKTSRASSSILLEKANALLIEHNQIATTIAQLDEKILAIMNKIRKESQDQLKLINRGKRAISGYRQEQEDKSFIDVQR